MKWGASVRDVLRSLGAVTFITEEKLYPDTAYLENGELKTKEYITEAALYTEIWSELFDRNTEPSMIQAVVNTMGLAPKTLTSPSVGRANLFIGLASGLTCWLSWVNTSAYWRSCGLFSCCSCTGAGNIL